MYPYKWKTFLITGIAHCHIELGNDSIALKNYLKATEDSSYMRISRSRVTTNTRIGHIYRYFNKYNLSEKFLKKALKASENSDYKKNLYGIYYGLGLIQYLHKSDIDSTLFYFEKGNKAYEEINVSTDVGFYSNKIYQSFVDIYTDKLDFGIKGLEDVANDIFLDKYDKYNKGAKEDFFIIYSELSRIYTENKDAESLKSISNKYIKFLESLHAKVLNKNIQNLEIKYQTKEKEASIAQLEQNKTQQEQIIRQQRIIGFSLGGLLLAFVGFGYLFWRQRKLKDQYEKENLEQRLLRSQMNPHFIGNAMNIVSSLVEKKSSEAIPFINKLSNLFRLILINSREEFVSLDEELETIKGYLDLQTKFVDQLEYQIKVDETIDEEEVIVSPMLIQPLVENAIKHGLMQVEREKLIEINVSVDKDSKLLLVEVKDNGIGMGTRSSSQIKKDSSVSGDVIKERLQILKKRFKVNTRINYLNLEQGTKVELYLPYLLDE
jgi:two-component sensor histidine kinase